MERLGMQTLTERAHYVREILGLSPVSVRRIARGRGISLRYSSLARRGLAVPHPMHNVALGLLVGCGEGV